MAQFFEDGIKMKINSEIKPPFLKHQLDFELDGRQLGRDFKRLRKLLDQFQLYKNSSLVGPDVNQLRAQWGKVFEKSQIIMDKLSLKTIGPKILTEISRTGYMVDLANTVQSRFSDIKSSDNL